MIYSIVIIIAVLMVWIGRMLWVAVGELPKGERLERCEKSPNWADGKFQNQEVTPELTSDEGTLAALWKFFFRSVENLNPSKSIPAVKTDLLHLDRNKDVCIWLGHSSVFLQVDGIRYLFDPVLTNKLPVWLFMRPYKGADLYTPDDIPTVDYLIITHNHWDHLDYLTVKALKDKVKNVVCGLGVGQNFEYWGYDPKVIHDVDWGDSIQVNNQTTLRCLPSRHFSGRLFGREKTLWASYLIDGPHRIFVSGDGGYDGRFKRYGAAYKNIDLAIMENGQYDKDWRYIHLLPSQLPEAIDDLSPKRVLTYHNSKFTLANHAWTEPLDSITENAKGKTWKLLTPRIGESVILDENQTFPKWW